MTRSLMAGLLAVAMGACAVPAAAQQAPPPSPDDTTPDGPVFLSKYNFHLAAAALSDDSPLFQWDATIGGDVDLLDYGRGRINALADYHVVLGNELQLFDPNQSLYSFDVSASIRIGRSEAAGYLHHVSRHLGDRVKEMGIDWNALGVRLVHRPELGRVTLVAIGQTEYVYKRTSVDYRVNLSGEATLRYPNDRRVSVVGGGRLKTTLTDEHIAGRSHVSGGLVHAGVRVGGPAGALELFVALERRIDPSPLSFGTDAWALAGFRLLSQ